MCPSRPVLTKKFTRSEIRRHEESSALIMEPVTAARHPVSWNTLTRYIVRVFIELQSATTQAVTIRMKSVPAPSSSFSRRLSEMADCICLWNFLARKSIFSGFL